MLDDEELLEIKFCELELDTSDALETEELMLDAILELLLFEEELPTETAFELWLDDFKDEPDEELMDDACEPVLAVDELIALLADAAIELELLTNEEELTAEGIDEALLTTEAATELELDGTTITSSIDELDELTLLDEAARLTTDDED